jgi:hypothetical protein
MKTNAQLPVQFHVLGLILKNHQVIASIFYSAAVDVMDYHADRQGMP